MAALLVDEDPETANLHALSAARRAGRVAVVRETAAITAYRTGDFATALRELRTYRRISGKNDQLPMMVDCERGLGRPERALELGRSVDRAALDTAVQVQPAIMECHMVAGGFDYLLKTRSADMNAYRAFAGAVLWQLPGVRETRTYAVMEEVKNSTHLQLPEVARR